MKVDICPPLITGHGSVDNSWSSSGPWSVDTLKSSNGSWCPDTSRCSSDPCGVGMSKCSKCLCIVDTIRFSWSRPLCHSLIVLYYIEAGNKNVVGPIVWPSSIAMEISEIECCSPKATYSPIFRFFFLIRYLQQNRTSIGSAYLWAIVILTYLSTKLCTRGVCKPAKMQCYL